ncbi:MAG: RlmE family RNA methyltransferase [Methanomicrobiales archaeon]|jgi:23S rRNA (uridine2552-2'-O)-methyltransferase|nr:RlmE family RNA methyltransferase [Methanomicrobiales archaeon]
MGSQWTKDKVYIKAMREGYRSRAAYKLKEIISKHPVLWESDNVIDLGCAPGSWLQVLRESVSGDIIGIDLNYFPPIEGVTTIIGSFTDPVVIANVREKMPVVNVIVSDASPKLSGHKSYDQAVAIGLNEDALSFAIEVLKPSGNMIMKSFEGEDFPFIFKKMQKHFFSVKAYKTKASRKGSTEIYIIAKKFKGKEFKLDDEEQEEEW